MAATAKMYRVYSVIQRPKQEDFWLNIGMAFPHEKGDGFNVVLQALPLHGNGKLVMRAFLITHNPPPALAGDTASAACAPRPSRGGGSWPGDHSGD